MAAERSSLETQVVSIMRSLRERGNVERKALARRLEVGRSQKLERVKRIGYVAGDGAGASPVTRERLG